ncbi:hypothetical protein HHK36_025385 [Tetracentron sinense]|uniref:Protein TIFY n=1 Tax=Tetracentron sinense TaxID=13715 RepID=A0A834YIM5_TETSI|nr:hypothetical protein HHK36_025385 [Tetracentron sinense]
MSSTSPDFSETGRFSGRKPAKAQEKSNFAQTMSLLSQYLKEKGTLGELSLGMSCNLEGKGKPETIRQTTTMNLLPNMDTSGDVSGRNSVASRNVKSMDLFPQRAGNGIAPSVTMEDVPKKADFSENKPATTEPETAQMAIFYAGQVHVFNDFPASKAREIMLLASKGSFQNPGNPTSSSGNDQVNSGNFAASGSNFAPLSGKKLPVASDLPIARKASLHRFLEKRKDRVSARAPYLGTSNNSTATTSKPAESKTWLGLAAAAQSSQQFELQ